MLNKYNMILRGKSFIQVNSGILDVNLFLYSYRFRSTWLKQVMNILRKFVITNSMVMDKAITVLVSHNTHNLTTIDNTELLIVFNFWR